MRYVICLSIALLTQTAYINSVKAAAQTDNEQIILAAEVIIDAFYSFDSTELEAALSTAKSSIPSIVYYQAETGFYPH